MQERGSKSFSKHLLRIGFHYERKRKGADGALFFIRSIRTQSLFGETGTAAGSGASASVCLSVKSCMIVVKPASKS